MVAEAEASSDRLAPYSSCSVLVQMYELGQPLRISELLTLKRTLHRANDRVNPCTRKAEERAHEDKLVGASTTVISSVSVCTCAVKMPESD